MSYLSTRVNLPSTQGETWTHTSNRISWSNLVALVQQMGSAPAAGWVMISRPLIGAHPSHEDDLSNVVTPLVPSGVYKINSKWQYVIRDPETGRYNRYTYKARPITDLSAEEAESWWQGWLIDQADSWFDSFTPEKFGYWKLSSEALGLQFDDESTSSMPGAGPRGAHRGGSGSNGNGNGKQSLIPWLVIAAFAAKILL